MTICQKISEKYKEMTETAVDFRALDFRQGKSQKEKALELKKRLFIIFRNVFAREESNITDDTVMCFCGISNEITGAWKKIPRNLMWIADGVDFRESQVTDLGQLQLIGGDAYFDDSQIVDLGQLQLICGDAYFSGSKIIQLGALKEVGWRIYIDRGSVLDFSGIKHGGIVYI